MKTLFDTVSFKCSQLTTKEYSTSFSLGILFLSKPLRPSIYSIYGFVRFADEIVDSFHGYDKASLLKKFKEETFEAIDKKISLNPILNSFQHTVREFNIEHELIHTFLDSMEMDLEETSYDRSKYEKYILGSAEVVGLMCLHVFAGGSRELYEQLKPYAMKLGAAFQKINFLRDLNADVKNLGRNYFPQLNLNNFDSECKKAIESEIQDDFTEALKGIKMLPGSSRAGVYLAYIYYHSLFKKIRKTNPQEVMQSRIRITDTHKIALMFRSLIQYHCNLV